MVGRGRFARHQLWQIKMAAAEKRRDKLVAEERAAAVHTVGRLWRGSLSDEKGGRMPGEEESSGQQDP